MSESNSNGKLKIKYKIARSCFENEDFKGAQKYYEEILREDIGSWEAVFFSTLSGAFDSHKLSEIKFAAKAMRESIESVLYGIYSQVPEAERISDCLMVGDQSLKAAVFLLEKLAGIVEESPDQNNDVLEAADDVALTMLFITGSIYRQTENPFLASEIADAAKNICLEAGISGEASSELIKFADTLNSVTATALKKDTEAVKSEISSLKESLTNIPGTEEIKKLRAEIESMETKQKSLGLFKSKEKKELKEKIDTLTRRVNDLSVKVALEEDAILDRIDELEEMLREYGQA